MTRPTFATVLLLLAGACTTLGPVAGPVREVAAIAAATRAEAAAEVAAVVRDAGQPVSDADRQDGVAVFAGLLDNLGQIAPAADAAPLPLTRSTGLPAFHVQTTPQRNDVAVFLDRDIFPELFRLLNGAKQRIQIDYFLLSGDLGLQIARILDDKVAHGVDVRVMLDSKQGIGGPLADGITKVIADLRAHDVPVKLYPIHLFGPPPNKIQRRIQIDHDKLIAIDGETAFVGSMNLHDRAMGNHDLMVRVDGPTANEVSAMMDAEWAVGTPVDARVTTPPPPAPKQTPPRGDTLMRLTQTAPQEKTTKALLLTEIRQASRLDIAMYLLAEPDLLAAVCEAAKRGVPVRVILDPRTTTTAKYGAIAHVVPDGMPNLLAAQELLKAGAKVHWFVPDDADQEAHMKLAIFNGRKAIAGSTNWTINSFVRWRDTSFTLEGPPVNRFMTMFEQDWQRTKPCDRLTFKQRIVARLVSYLNKRDYGFW